MMAQSSIDPIVQALRDARLAQGLTLRALGRRSTVDYKTISNWENGASPRLRDLRLVATALRVELEAWPAPTAAPVVDEVLLERACRGQAVELTAPERTAAVLKLHGRGLNATEIAERLRITTRTVQRQLAAARTRGDLRDRAEAAA
jgi:transcriptional regulator with XRE-family HTH domain